MLVLLLAAGSAAAVAEAAAAARNWINFNLTLSDQSPLVIFEEGGPWNSSFSKSDWSTYKQGQAGKGDSWHWINNGPATRSQFSVDLHASAIVVIGDKNGSPPPDGAINASIDRFSDTGNSTKEDVPTSEDIKLSAGQLVRLSNLDVGKQNVVTFSIQDQVPGMYNVREVVVTTAMMSDAKTLDKVPVTTVPFVIDGAPNPTLGIAGQEWNVITSTIYDGDFAFNATELVYPKGDSLDSGFFLQVPLHTSYILINGTVGPGRGQPRYTWNHIPPGQRSADTLGPKANATSPWVSGQQLFVQQLDPDANYVLQVQPSDQGDVYLHTVTFYSGNLPVSSNSKPSTGAIVGGVVGGVVGALLIGLALFYFFSWRPRKRRDREEDEAVSRRNAGFVPFGSESAEPTIMQETDAGTAVPPPEYNPEWGTAGAGDARPALAPTSDGSTVTPLEKTPLAWPQGLAPNSASSPLAPLASWKAPYVAGDYAGAQVLPEEPAMSSAMSPVVDDKAPFLTGLPPGAAMAQRPGAMSATSPKSAPRQA